MNLIVPCQARDWFSLQHQPDETQRKAYKNENRYLLPNPITIVCENPSIQDGYIEVELVHQNGEPLTLPENPLEGTLARSFDGKKNTAEFVLKCRQSSGQSKYKLKFSISFLLDGKQEKLSMSSDAFRVLSNKKKKGPNVKAPEPPRVLRINPTTIPVKHQDHESEVCVKRRLLTN